MAACCVLFIFPILLVSIVLWRLSHSYEAPQSRPIPRNEEPVHTRAFSAAEYNKNRMMVQSSADYGVTFRAVRTPSQDIKEKGGRKSPSKKKEKK